MDKEKEKIYYEKLLQGWINTRMERDRSILMISAGAIGLLLTLILNIEKITFISYLLFASAIFTFAIVIFTSIAIFEKNSYYIENIIKKNIYHNEIENDIKTKLFILDRLIIWGFIIGIMLSLLLGLNLIKKKTKFICKKENKTNINININQN